MHSNSGGQQNESPGVKLKLACVLRTATSGDSFCAPLLLDCIECTPEHDPSRFETLE